MVAVSNGRLIKDLIADERILILPGVYDGYSMRLVERHDFQAAFVTGAGLAESRFGFPDVGLIGFREVFDGAATIASLTQIPLLVDADTGYGNAVNVHFTVEAFERIGVGGIVIEDQRWPKRCGHIAGNELESADEMVKKVRSAINARRDSNFVIVARTDAASTLGVKEAIRRANLYSDAGADLLFADALRSQQDIEQFVREVRGPVCLNMGFGIRARPTTPLVSAAQLEAMGAAVVLYPRLLTAAAIKGMEAAISVFQASLTSREILDRDDLAVSFDDLNNLIGLPRIHELEAAYMVEP